jgi:hypothetical protein
LPVVAEVDSTCLLFVVVVGSEGCRVELVDDEFA